MTDTRQPIWELILNLGDKNFIEHGGFFVFRDTTGVYSEEAEMLIPNKEATEWQIYRFGIERLKIVSGYLVPFEYDLPLPWPQPAGSYDEWFHANLPRVAAANNMTTEHIREGFCSPDPIVRASAYRAVAMYHGIENFDSYPLIFRSRAAVQVRYARELVRL